MQGRTRRASARRHKLHDAIACDDRSLLNVRCTCSHPTLMDRATHLFDGGPQTSTHPMLSERRAGRAAPGGAKDPSRIPAPCSAAKAKATADSHPSHPLAPEPSQSRRYASQSAHNTCSKTQTRTGWARSALAPRSPNTHAQSQRTTPKLSGLPGAANYHALGSPLPSLLQR